MAALRHQGVTLGDGVAQRYNEILVHRTFSIPSVVRLVKMPQPLA